jgi:hypothetical protein
MAQWDITLDIYFKIFTFSTFPLWMLIIILPQLKVTKYLSSSNLPTIFYSIFYLFFIVTGFIFTTDKGSLSGDFGSLDGLILLFKNKFVKNLLIKLTNAAWLHYLAFDLFVGMWIHRDSRNLQIPVK